MDGSIGVGLKSEVDVRLMSEVDVCLPSRCSCVSLVVDGAHDLYCRAKMRKLPPSLAAAALEHDRQ
jgi:hypothetical protein